MSETALEGPIRLEWQPRLQKYLVHDDDGDRYLIAADEWRRLSRRAAQERSSLATFQDLLNSLGEWANDHADKLERAFCTIRDSGLLFLVVMKGRKHDRDLEDDLTDLDLAVARHSNYHGVRLSVLALPNCDADGYMSFLRPGLFLSYEGIHAEGKRTRRPGSS